MERDHSAKFQTLFKLKVCKERIITEYVDVPFTPEAPTLDYSQGVVVKWKKSVNATGLSSVLVAIDNDNMTEIVIYKGNMLECMYIIFKKMEI